MGKKHVFVLTQKEFLFAFILALLGFAFSAPEFLLFLNSLGIFFGWLVYEAIFYAILLGFAVMGLAAFGKKITNPFQVFGLFLVFEALFIVINFENPFVQYVTMHNFDGASQVFFQSEDGIAWTFWYGFIGIKDLLMARLLTFVATPFVLASIGGFLVTKIEL